MDNRTQPHNDLAYMQAAETAAATIARIRGKWAIKILAVLSLKPHKISELRRRIPGLSNATLIKNLRKLESYDLIKRADTSPQSRSIEYSIAAPIQHRIFLLVRLLADFDLRI